MAKLSCFSEPELRAFLQGNLADDRLRALAEHLRGCPDCSLAVARLDGVNETALDMLRQAAASGDNARTVVQVATPASSAAPPEFIGEYELLGQIGQGGMGIVYKARHRRLRREVAVKTMKAGSGASSEVRDRFRREAEAMALLQHRNIVQIFEVGEEEGAPFLVMEYVDGVTLARKLAGTPLPPGEAADLVQTLAQAVAYAHQRGVLHRDLTPTNVLLQAQGLQPLGLGSPKIADFGLARLLLGDSTLTQTGVVMGTPSYLAPEQADGKGKDAGPAADTYALGAILYECLTGRPPFKAATALETIKQVVNDDPVPPRQLQPRTPRDLETICLKCLEKSPQRRYADADALARDLGHFLAGESIDARRTGLLGRAGRWGRRRPLVAGLLLALVVVTAGSFGLVTWKWREEVQQRQRAEQQEEEAHRQRAKAEERLTQAVDVVEAMLTRVGADSLAGVPHAEAVRRELLDKAMLAFEGLRRQEGDDPRIRSRAAYACRRTAELLKDLSRLDEGLTVCRQAIELGERLVADFPDRANYRSELAMSHGTMANLLSNLARLDEADQESQAGLAIHRVLTEQFPDDARYWHELAVGLTNRAVLLRQLKRPDEAEQMQRDMQQIESRLAAKYPDDQRYRYTLASSHYDLGNLMSAGKRPREAEGEYRRAVSLLEDLIKEKPDAPVNPHLLGRVRHNLGTLLPPEGKEKEMRLARDLHERLVEDYSAVPTYRVQLALHLDSLGGLLKTKNPAEAEEVYRQAARHRRRLVRDFPDSVEYQSALMVTLGRLATVLHERRTDVKEARRLFEEIIPHEQAALKADQKNAYYRRSLRDHWWGLADTLGLLGEHDEMARAVAELPRLYPEGWQQHFTAGQMLLWGVALAGRDSRLGADERQTRVLAYARQGRDLLREALPHNPGLDGFWYHLALFEALLDDGAGYRQACQDMEKRFGNSKDVEVRHWVARASSVAPDSCVDPGRCVELAEGALKAVPGSYFYLTWVGAALYRAGRYPEALGRLEAAARAHGAGGAGFDLLLRALIHEKLHDVEKARQCLAGGRRWQESMEKKELNDPIFGQEMSANQYAELRLLRREAERVLGRR